MIKEEAWCHGTCLQTAGKQSRLTEPAVTLLPRVKSGPVWVKNAHTKTKRQTRAAGSPGEASPSRPMARDQPSPCSSVMAPKRAPFL